MVSRTNRIYIDELMFVEVLHLSQEERRASLQEK